ncbi:hypothetical protein L3Q82_016554 [Scortum barcoo]|uniref:Uncharacterized protein n=1 Tax=Scortum barcoo TaxID=214431 RepID=A0ACB8X7D7_9TELE|nr:hypothetical protein L3Q82_016554 [Scortum barcoo]
MKMFVLFVILVHGRPSYLRQTLQRPNRDEGRPATNWRPQSDPETPHRHRDTGEYSCIVYRKRNILRRKTVEAQSSKAQYEDKVSQHASAVELYEGEEFVLLPCEYQTFNLDDPTVVWRTLRSQSSNSPPASLGCGTYTCTVKALGGQWRVKEIQLERNKDCYVTRIGVTGAPPWSQAWGWGSQAAGMVAGSLAHGTQPGSARNGDDVGPPSSRLTTHRKIHEGPVQCGLGSSRGRGPRRPNPWTKTLAIGTWNVTSLGGKEPELVREVERYRLERDSRAHLHA